MSQYIFQGSAEHVSALLPVCGLGCPHYLVSSSEVSQTKCYPKRLGLFSSHNHDLIVFYLDTKNICSDCLKLFVPSGFNFWSFLPDPSGRSQSEKPDSPTRKWLVPSGPSEQFINLRKIGGGASDTAIIPLPSSPAATAAWEWIKSQKKPFYIDQLHLAPRWSPVNERNALADSATARQYGISMPTPAVEAISAPRGKETTVAKVPKPTTSKDSPSKPKTSTDAVDLPEGKKPRKSRDSVQIAVAQAVSTGSKKKVDGAVSGSNPLSAVEPSAKQNGQGLTSPKEKVNAPHKEKVKPNATLPSGESKPVKARGSLKLASPPAPQYTLSAMEELKPQQEPERPNLACPVASPNQPGPSIRRKAVGAISKKGNAAVEVTEIGIQEVDSTTEENANNQGKELASGSVFSLLSKPSPGPQTLDFKTKSPEEETASIKSKSKKTNKEAHTELKVAERSKESSRKSSKARPVGMTKEMPALVKTVAQSKTSSSQTTSVSTYTRSWYNHDPFSFDGAMTLPRLSDYKRRARTINTYAERAPELPLETLLRKTQPLDKSKTLLGLKATKDMKKEDPITTLFSSDAKDKKPSKLPLGSALGMKAILQAEPSSGKKHKPPSAQDPVKAKSEKRSSAKPQAETLSEWTREVQKMAKVKTEQFGRSPKDRVSKDVNHGGKVTRSEPEAKAGRIGTHSKDSSSHGGRQSSTTVVNHDHIHHKQPKKKVDGHKGDKPHKKPYKIPGRKPHPDHAHGHGHDAHGSHGHDSPGQHEQQGEDQRPSENEQQGEHPGYGPEDNSPTESGQSATQPVDNSTAPNSPVESNSPGTNLQPTVACAPHPVPSTQEPPDSSINPNAQDPSFDENTAGVQSRPDTHPTGVTPQDHGENVQGNTPGNECSLTEVTATAADTVASTPETSPPDKKPESRSLNGNRTEPSSTMPSNGPQEATVAGSWCAQEYYGQSTAQSAQNVQVQANYIPDPVPGSRGGLDGSGQPSSGKQTPPIQSSKLSSRNAFIAGTGIVGVAALAGGLAATNASSSSDTSDAEKDYIHENDMHEQQSLSYEDLDNESSHEAMGGHSYKQSSEDEEGDEGNIEQHDSGSGAESASEDLESLNADFEQGDDNEQYDFVPDSYSGDSSHHSGEVEVLSQDEDQDQDQDQDSSDHGFDNESNNGDSDQGSLTDSGQSIQGDTEDNLDAESGQEESGHENDSDTDQDLDQMAEDDSEQSSDNDNVSDPQSSDSSENDSKDSSDGGGDESTEDEQSDQEPDNSEPGPEDVSEDEQGTYSYSEGDDSAFNSD